MSRELFDIATLVTLWLMYLIVGSLAFIDFRLGFGWGIAFLVIMAPLVIGGTIGVINIWRATR